MISNMKQQTLIHISLPYLVNKCTNLNLEHWGRLLLYLAFHSFFSFNFVILKVKKNSKTLDKTFPTHVLSNNNLLPLLCSVFLFRIVLYNTDLSKTSLI